MAETEWRTAQARHEARLGPVIEPLLQRRRRNISEPISDFVFEYYSFRPTRLRRWTPGFGVILEGDAEDFLGLKGFARVKGGVAADPALFPARRLEGVRWTRDMLAATQRRPAFWGCHCLHEWAMVYRASSDRRHHEVPLRVSAQELQEIVEDNAIVCTHWDAFRHFTEAARPLNTIQPTWEDMADLEQPGCLHTNMDVYRWAYKLWPWIDSELLADCFFFALEVREVDMRASPYDFSDRGLAPIQIETACGKREFQAAQRAISEKARILRQRLIVRYTEMLAWSAS